jgi:hypothetical protein
MRPQDMSISCTILYFKTDDYALYLTRNELRILHRLSLHLNHSIISDDEVTRMESAQCCGKMEGEISAYAVTFSFNIFRYGKFPLTS